MTQEVKGRFVNPYECANIGNDDYTTYPVDAEGKVTQVDTIENGKLLKFITPANAKARMNKQMVDNLKVDLVAPAYEPYTFASSAAAYTGLNSMSGPRTSADKTFVDTDPLVNSIDCVYVTGGSTQLYTTVNGEYKKILKICTTSDIGGAADYLWPIVWVEGDDVTSLASASIRLLEPRTVGDIPNLFKDVSYYTATGL